MTERIVVSGGTGYVGTALVKRLSATGKEVVVLARSGRLPPSLQGLSGVSAVPWDARSLGAWASSVDGAAAIVHLAGEPAVGQRFTDSVKTRIFESRVKSAEALVQAIERAERRPSVLVSASGVGYYGPRGEEPCDETTAAGDDFLARVCIAWEGAARAAEPLGVRVAITRLGVVLGPGGGALPVMARPFKLFAGGKLGDGRQFFSWVHLDDAVAVLERCLNDESISGPLNVAAPEAVPQADFAEALGRALHRPAWLPAPSFALKLLFGEGSGPILTGQRAVPKRLEALGFQFRHPRLEETLSDALGS
jgi:uncharacterized protein (TIGR01777 family)